LEYFSRFGILCQEKSGNPDPQVDRSREIVSLKTFAVSACARNVLNPSEADFSKLSVGKMGFFISLSIMQSSRVMGVFADLSGGKN
jgi:hypothetical protein